MKLREPNAEEFWGYYQDLESALDAAQHRGMIAQLLGYSEDGMANLPVFAYAEAMRQYQAFFVLQPHRIEEADAGDDMHRRWLLYFPAEADEPYAEMRDPLLWEDDEFQSSRNIWNLVRRTCRLTGGGELNLMPASASIVLTTAYCEAVVNPLAEASRSAMTPLSSPNGA